MLKVIMYGLVFGLCGAGLGGIIGTIFGKSSKRNMALLLNVSGGIMISVVCFDLLPEAIGLSGVTLALCAMFLGALTVLLLNDIIDSRFKTKTFKNGGDKNTMLRAGFTISIAIAIHNFPEGLAIGSGEVIDRGLILAILIALHDIPEGVAMAVPLRAGGMRASTTIFLSFLSGLPTALGAVAGYLIGSVSPMLVSTSMALAGGAMLYVTFGEVFNRSKSLYSGRLPIMVTILGVAIGIIIIYAL